MAKVQRSSSAGESIHFGSFVLDLRAGSLLRRRTPIKLRRKSWQVLRHLAERPGALVTADELLDIVWEGAHVTPQALTNVIAQSDLRHCRRCHANRSVDDRSRGAAR